jgi:hypothetical protein
MHVFEHPIHPVGVFSAAFRTDGTSANAIAAKNGKALFAAFLKNSLLLRNSSFLLLFSSIFQKILVIEFIVHFAIPLQVV